MCLFGNTFKIGNNYIAINGSKNEKDCLALMLSIDTETVATTSHKHVYIAAVRLY